MNTLLPSIHQQPKQQRTSTITKNSKGQAVRVIVVSNNYNNHETSDHKNSISKQQQQNGIIIKTYNKQSEQPQRKIILKHAGTRKRDMINGHNIKHHNQDTSSSVHGSNSTRADSSDSNRTNRKLWWSPKRNEVQVKSDDTKYYKVGSKVGSLVNINHKPGGGNVAITEDRTKWIANSKIGSLENANWSPPLPQISVRNEKLIWNAGSKIGSMININHRPGGGSISIRDEQLDFREKATPRVDCGFVDE
ncbi:unnamed protein product [Didymodactylos carnosus]|uniref:Microtubule-associated protein n=1 Tax=Didymodactylos carnosus TaxID=1234261 RepID=A0A813Z6C7_9BILA|nr:unnamed protein product [Didymodactylos carnosus]CAF0983684.1 unnamed protein product [Didymodactylos carnosus]CAF3678529.1 unnamed protein product [Didymodactylos carnosus]CAF3754104.1 unnamed protein product [Didymodactylos carnosus]